MLYVVNIVGAQRRETTTGVRKVCAKESVHSFMNSVGPFQQQTKEIYNNLKFLPRRRNHAVPTLPKPFVVLLLVHFICVFFNGCNITFPNVQQVLMRQQVCINMPNLSGFLDDYTYFKCGQKAHAVAGC